MLPLLQPYLIILGILECSSCHNYICHLCANKMESKAEEVKSEQIYCPLCQATKFVFIDVDINKSVRKYTDTHSQKFERSIHKSNSSKMGDKSICPVLTASKIQETPKLDLIPEFDPIHPLEEKENAQSFRSLKLYQNSTKQKINRCSSYKALIKERLNFQGNPSKNMEIPNIE